MHSAARRRHCATGPDNRRGSAPPRRDRCRPLVSVHVRQCCGSSSARRRRRQPRKPRAARRHLQRREPGRDVSILNVVEHVHHVTRPRPTLRRWRGSHDRTSTHPQQPGAAEKPRAEQFRTRRTWHPTRQPQRPPEHPSRILMRRARSKHTARQTQTVSTRDHVPLKRSLRMIHPRATGISGIYRHVFPSPNERGAPRSMCAASTRDQCRAVRPNLRPPPRRQRTKQRGASNLPTERSREADLRRTGPAPYHRMQP